MEFPHFQKLYNHLKERGLEVLAVNAISATNRSPNSGLATSKYESNDLINRFVAYNKITMPIGLSDLRDAQSMSGSYGWGLFYIIDKNGKVIHKSRSGQANIAELREVLARMGVK